MKKATARAGGRTHARAHTQRGTFMKLKTLNMRFDYEINLR
jgi:hypothetical protein